MKITEQRPPHPAASSPPSDQRSLGRCRRLNRNSRKHSESQKGGMSFRKSGGECCCRGLAVERGESTHPISLPPFLNLSVTLRQPERSRASKFQVELTTCEFSVVRRVAVHGVRSETWNADHMLGPSHTPRETEQLRRLRIVRVWWWRLRWDNAVKSIRPSVEAE